MRLLITLYSLLSSLLLVSACADEFNIAGESSLPILDGKVLHLRVKEQKNDMVAHRDLDSCQVIHGKFGFFGNVDTVCMAQIYVGQDQIMPIVLENGKIFISVDNMGQQVKGGPLNDKLYKYLNQQRLYYNEWMTLQEEYIQRLRKGDDNEKTQARLAPKFLKNKEKSERLETHFIIENANNVLGPGYLMMILDQYPIPIITEQLNEIIASNPKAFLSHPEIYHYIRAAQLNPLSEPFILGGKKAKATKRSRKNVQQRK